MAPRFEGVTVRWNQKNPVFAVDGAQPRGIPQPIILMSDFNTSSTFPPEARAPREQFLGAIFVCRDGAGRHTLYA